jgi:hypothetical protein
MTTKNIDIKNILRLILLIAISLTIGIGIGISIGKTNNALSLDHLRGVGELNHRVALHVVGLRNVSSRFLGERLTGVESLDVASVKLKGKDADSLDVLGGRLQV